MVDGAINAEPEKKKINRAIKIWPIVDAS